MSHVATVAVEVKDLAALRAACAAVGLEFREGQKTHRWYGKWVNDYSGANAAFRAGISPSDYGKCDHAIGVPGNARAYEIGVVRRPNGSYALAWDFFGGGFGLEAVAGAGCSKLVTAYVQEVATRSLRLQGYVPSGKKTLADGTVELVFTGGK